LGPLGLMLCLVQGYERDGRGQARRGRGKGAGRTGHYNDTTTTTTTLGLLGITLEPSQGSIDVRKGQSANIIITIYSVNGYSGYVALSALCESGPACEAGKLGFSFNPGTVYVPAGGYATSTMTITADKTAPVAL